MDWEAERLEIRRNVGRYVNEAYEKSMRSVSDDVHRSRTMPSRWLPQADLSRSDAYPAVPPPPPQALPIERQIHVMYPSSQKEERRRDNGFYYSTEALSPPLSSSKKMDQIYHTQKDEELRKEVDELRRDIAAAFSEARSDAQRGKERIETVAHNVSGLEEKARNIDENIVPRVERTARQVVRRTEELTEIITNIRRNIATRASSDDTTFRKTREAIAQLRGEVEARPSSQAVETIAQDAARDWLDRDPSAKDWARSQARRVVREIMDQEHDSMLCPAPKKNNTLTADDFLMTTNTHNDQDLMKCLGPMLAQDQDVVNRLAHQATPLIRNTAVDIATAAAVASIAAKSNDASTRFHALISEVEERHITNQQADRQLAKTQIEAQLFECEQRLTESMHQKTEEHNLFLKSTSELKTRLADSEVHVVQMKTRLTQIEDSLRATKKNQNEDSPLFSKSIEQLSTRLHQVEDSLRVVSRDQNHAEEALHLSKSIEQLSTRLHQVEDSQRVVSRDQNHTEEALHLSKSIEQLSTRLHQVEDSLRVVSRDQNHAEEALHLSKSIEQLSTRLHQVEDSQRVVSRDQNHTEEAFHLSKNIEKRISTEVAASREIIEQDIRQDQEATTLSIKNLKHQVERQSEQIQKLHDTIEDIQTAHANDTQKKETAQEELAKSLTLLKTQVATKESVSTHTASTSSSDHDEKIRLEFAQLKEAQEDAEKRFKSEMSAMRELLEEQRLALLDELERRESTTSLNDGLETRLKNEIEALRVQVNKNNQEYEASKTELSKALEASETQLSDVQRRLANETKTAAIAQVKLNEMDRRLRRHSSNSSGMVRSPARTLDDEASIASSIDTEDSSRRRPQETKIITAAEGLKSPGTQNLYSVLAGTKQHFESTQDTINESSQEEKDETSPIKALQQQDESIDNIEEDNRIDTASPNTTSQCQFCMRRMPRREMPAHVANECKLAIVECTLCGERVRRWNLMQHQRNTCPSLGNDREDSNEDFTERPLSYSSDDTTSVLSNPLPFNDHPKTPTASTNGHTTTPRKSPPQAFSPPTSNSTTTSQTNMNTSIEKKGRNKSPPPSTHSPSPKPRSIGGGLLSSLRVRGSKKKSEHTNSDDNATPDSTAERTYTFDSPTFSPSGPTFHDDTHHVDATTWTPSDTASYVLKRLSLQRVADLILKHKVTGTKLIHMTEPDLLAPEPHGLGLSSTEAGQLMSLVQELILMRAQSRR